MTFLCNRGANGIDGLVSSGIGAAAASGRPTWILHRRPLPVTTTSNGPRGARGRRAAGAHRRAQQRRRRDLRVPAPGRGIDRERVRGAARHAGRARDRADRGAARGSATSASRTSQARRDRRTGTRSSRSGPIAARTSSSTGGDRIRDRGRRERGRAAMSGVAPPPPPPLRRRRAPPPAPPLPTWTPTQLRPAEALVLARRRDRGRRDARRVGCSRSSMRSTRWTSRDGFQVSLDLLRLLARRRRDRRDDRWRDVVAADRPPPQPAAAATPRSRVAVVSAQPATASPATWTPPSTPPPPQRRRADRRWRSRSDVRVRRASCAREVWYWVAGAVALVGVSRRVDRPTPCSSARCCRI